MKKNSNPARVGEILLKAGIIDEMQLTSALGEQKQWGRRLGVTLVKLGMVTETDLIRALAQQLGLPVASPTGKRIPDEVLALVPARVAFERGVLPLFLKPGERNSVLYLGMEDPSDVAVLDDLSFRTGLEIRPVMVGPTELSVAIDRFYLRSGGRKEENGYASGETLGELNLRRMEGGPEVASAAESAPEVSPPVQVEPEEKTEPPAVIDLEPRQVLERRAPKVLKATRPVDPVVGPQDSSSEIRAVKSTEPAPEQPESLPELKPKTPSAVAATPEARIEALEAELRSAVLETEKTRVVLKAMTQILVERGLLPFTLLQERAAHLKEEEIRG